MGSAESLLREAHRFVTGYETAMHFGCGPDIDASRQAKLFGQKLEAHLASKPEGDAGRLCEHCGSNRVISYRDAGCPKCGAPVCCQVCCDMESLEREVAALRSAQPPAVAMKSEIALAKRQQGQPWPFPIDPIEGVLKLARRALLRWQENYSQWSESAPVVMQNKLPPADHVQALERIDEVLENWGAAPPQPFATKGAEGQRESPVPYIELNMSNYNADDVSQLNEWAIWAYGQIYPEPPEQSAAQAWAVFGPDGEIDLTRVTSYEERAFIPRGYTCRRVTITPAEGK